MTTERFQLSAVVQEYLQGLRDDPGPVHFGRSEIEDHAPPETFEGFAWYVVYTNIKCERRAQLGLRRKGYQTYLPFQKVDVRHARKIDVVEKPLLPRYLFIGLTTGQDFYHMRGVDGVESIVRNNMVPVMIKPDHLKVIRDREAAGAFDYSGAEKRRKAALVAQCKPGSAVEITTGPMSGLRAIVEHVQATGHIQALIDFFGRSTPVRIGIEEVELLEVTA